MGKIITFGELMLRLQPYNYERFVQASTVEFSFGGGEANVAVSLANYGLDAAYVTKLPAHAIGQAAVNSLRRYGVDTSLIVRGGDRVGIYYNEKGASQRGSVCIYDRANSAIAKASAEDFDWDEIFDGAEWFHFTGITPALGENVAAICLDACKAAKAKGIQISCDLNYRGKLWTKAQARETMTELCKYVDVCISNEEDAKDVFGIEAEATDIYGGKLNHEGYKSVAKQLADKFGFEKVAITLRSSISANDNDWAGMLYDAATGWYDAVIARYAQQVNGIDYWALTKLDVMDTLPKIKICVAYELDGKQIDYMPSSSAELARVKPVYEEMDGWLCETSNITKIEDLPPKAKAYVDRLMELSGAKLGILSIGPARESTLRIAL